MAKQTFYRGCFLGMAAGDAMGNQLMLVMGMMVLSAAGVVALLTAKARKAC